MKNPNLFLVGSVVLILLAVALVAILDRTTNNANDVRARAGSNTTTALQLTATVASVDEAKGTVTVNNAQFSKTSLAGAARNLGSYVVTPPAGFNFASVSQGMQILMNIDSTTFQVTNHTITALTLVPAK